MSVVARPRSAVSPLRRPFVAYPVRRPTVDEVVAVARPEEPVHCLRPTTVAETARGFVEGFPGDVLYAVKCNPDPAVLRALWDGGVRHFDCASLPEIRLVRDMFPEAIIHFMHPIKARGAIRDLGKALGLPLGEVERFARAVDVYEASRDAWARMEETLGKLRARSPRWRALAELADEGLVEAVAEKQGVGRPARYWHLTPAAHNRFPNTPGPGRAGRSARWS